MAQKRRKRNEGKVADPTWRQLRATAGGYARVVREKDAQLKTTSAALAKALTSLEEERATRTGGAAGAEIAMLRRELGHATDCACAECDRCAAAGRRLEDPRAQFTREASMVEALTCLGEVFTQSCELLASSRARGVGSAQARAAALTSLASAVRRASRSEAVEEVLP